MRIVCQTFSLPKAGREFADCEDAYFPGDSSNLAAYNEEHDDVPLFRTAVCDGATDSCFSKFWAQLLAADYGAGRLAEDACAASIAEAQDAWHAFLSKQELPWYAEEKAEMGAFAALAGLTLLEESRLWKALAIGDSCIFQTRKNECLVAFPILASAKFSNFPYLLSSVVERNGDVFAHKETITDGQWQPGDVFFLMSDAMACWFLESLEKATDNGLIARLTNLSDLESFKQLIEAERKRTDDDSGASSMKDDDVTFVRVLVTDGPSLSRAAVAPGEAIPKNASYRRFSSEFIKPPEMQADQGRKLIEQPASKSEAAGGGTAKVEPTAKRRGSISPLIIAVAVVFSLTIVGVAVAMLAGHNQTSNKPPVTTPALAPVDESKQSALIEHPKHKHHKPIHHHTSGESVMPKPAPQRIMVAPKTDGGSATVPDVSAKGSKTEARPDDSQPKIEQFKGSN